jgi:hypothetical protein
MTNRISNLQRPDPYLILTLLLSLFAIGPLMQPGYFWGAHDARHSVYFLFEFNKSIQDGILWPRWGPDWGFGYGYPFWNVYGPLTYFVAEGVHLLGFEVVPAVKIVFALSILGSAGTMYLFVRRLMGRPAGLIAGLVYVYVPYRLFDLYVRADLAESFSFVFIPLVLWGFYELMNNPRLNALIGAGIAYAGLVLTSNAALLLVSPLLGAFVAIMILLRLRDQASQNEGRRLKHTLKRIIRLGIPPTAGLALGIGLSAIFLLPLLLEFNYVRIDQWTGGRFRFGDDFVYFFQLFSPHWGFGASIPGPDDQPSFQLGLVPLILFILSFLIVPRVPDTNSRRLLYFLQAMTLLLVFLMIPASKWLWQTIPISTFAQFPWRLGLLTSMSFAIISGAIVAGDRNSGATGHPIAESAQEDLLSFSGTYVNLSLISLVILVILGSYPYLHAEVRDPMPNEGPVSLAALFRYQQSADDMTGSTAWTRRIPGWSVLAEQVAQGGSIDTRVNYTAIPPGDVLGVHSVEISTVHELVWVYAADDRQSVTFFIPYYPGWTAYIYEDLGPPIEPLQARVGRLVDKPSIRTTQYEGWMVVPVPQGEHFLEIRFEDTPVRIVGKWISLATLIALVASMLARRLLRGLGP